VITRRELLTRSIGVVGLAALSCGDNASDHDVAVAVLEPSTDAVIVAVWARRERAATVVIAGNEIDVELGESGSGAVDVTGLEPGTEYEVIVVVGGTKHGPFRAVTAPALEDGRPVKLAIIADLDPSSRFESDLVDHVVAAAPDLLIGLGDIPYCDNGPDLAKTPAAYRDRHAEARAHDRFRPLFQAAAMRAIYDDHEFRNNWDAAFVAEEPERYRAAVDVWDEFFPIRDAEGEVRYRRWRWGANVECFLLDCRRFRSANADPDGPAKTMLGATQLAWLLDAVTASTATFKLLLTSVPLDFDVGDDAWSSYQTERQVLLDGLVGISGLVVITADQHWFAAHVHTHGIREFQFGPLARDVRTPGPAGPGVLARALEFNAGIVEIDGSTIKISAIGTGGRVLFATTLTAEQLTPV
jgi:phosphodiesterase/alkaline phosphatase D-like protein